METTMDTAQNLTAADLAPLGFVADPQQPEGKIWLTHGHIRIALEGEDGVALYAFVISPDHGLLAWGCSFDGATPAEVVLATILRAIGPAAAPRFAAQEVAYRLPGKGWKRSVCRTQAALDRLLAKLGGRAELRFRNAD
jgi:hypothetical protein